MNASGRRRLPASGRLYTGHLLISIETTAGRSISGGPQSS